MATHAAGKRTVVELECELAMMRAALDDTRAELSIVKGQLLGAQQQLALTQAVNVVPECLHSVQQMLSQTTHEANRLSMLMLSVCRTFNMTMDNPQQQKQTYCATADTAQHHL
jgi:hypothetical protein